MVRLRTGRPGLVPTPEEAEAYEFSPMEREFVDSWNANVIHGTADEVRAGLDDLQKRTGADELMITANAHSGDVRLRSYELIADAYGLPTRLTRPTAGAASLGEAAPPVPHNRRRSRQEAVSSVRRYDPAPPGVSTASPGRCRSRSGAAARPARPSPRTPR